MDTKDMRIAVASQITFLELAANALQDPLLGFRLARDADLREWDCSTMLQEHRRRSLTRFIGLSDTARSSMKASF
jgi:hypothetical protein